MNSKSIQRVLLGVTGGVAAYKAAEWVRLAQKSGLTVRVVMTRAATRFVGPETFQALTGEPVYTDAWDERIPNRMPHIELTRWADILLVAPATADFIARAAAGLADDLLSTCAVSRNCPLWIAPAMNREMWEHPATVRNVARLKEDGVVILGPDAGEQACGETGLGRLIEPQAILAEVLSGVVPTDQPSDLQGLLLHQHVVVTAGPTFEPIDPVRGITNMSSGKMGYAVARACREAGARVTLVSGPTSLAAPEGVERLWVQTAEEMYAAVMAVAAHAQLFFSVAAVADYTPVLVREEKLKKSDEALSLQLKPTPDILSAVASLKTPPFCVGFAAETEHIEEHAAEKRRKKNIPLIAANDARLAIGQDTNTLILIDEHGRHVIGPKPKDALARDLVRHVVRLYSPS